MNVPLLVKLPPNTIEAFILFVQVPLLVKSPVNVFVVNALLMVMPELEAIDVTPETVSEVVNAFIVNVPAVTVRLPETVVAPVPVKVAPYVASLSSMLPKKLVAPEIA